MRKMSGKKEAQKAGLAAEQGNRRRRGGKRLSPAPARRWVEPRPRNGRQSGTERALWMQPVRKRCPSIRPPFLTDLLFGWVPTARRTGNGEACRCLPWLPSGATPAAGSAEEPRGKRTVGDSFTLTDGILCAVLFRRSRAATAHRAVPGRKAAGTSALWRRASASGGQMRLAGSGANFPGRSSAFAMIRNGGAVPVSSEERAGLPPTEAQARRL